MICPHCSKEMLKGVDLTGFHGTGLCGGCNCIIYIENGGARKITEADADILKSAGYRAAEGIQTQMALRRNRPTQLQNVVFN